MNILKIFDLFVEPANYTLDAIENVYSKLDVDYAFIYDVSKANIDAQVNAPVLSKMGKFKLLRYVWQTLKSYDIFIINGYTDKFCLLFIFLNILFFKKPYAIDSDTELRIPNGRLKKCVKWSFLKIVFGRSYAYGFAGGYFEHVKLFTHYGMDKNRVFVSPMMVDNARYTRTIVPEPGELLRVGYLGRLIKLKQVDKLVEVVKRLTKRGVKVELSIVGDGEERAELEQLANGSNNIHFYGMLFGKDKIKELHNFDVLVLYSDYEPWGLVINEALASGIPCIVSDKVGAKNDLILGGEATGIVVAYDNVCALEKAIKQLSEDRKLWRDLSRAALKRMAYWNYELSLRNLKSFLAEIDD